MPLPTISTPTYELTLPSSNRKIKYRPFLVKEEKILILAMESQDSKQIARAVKDVIAKCILSKGIKVEKLATFDIEYLFLNIRGKSVGEDIEVMVRNIESSQERLALGIKQLTEAHVKNLDEKYPLNAEVTGMVVNLTDFGIFVEVSEGVEGLVHISEIDTEIPKEKLQQFYPVNAQIRARVIKVDLEERRLGLSIIEVTETPAESESPASSNSEETVEPEAEVKQEEAKVEAEETPEAETIVAEQTETPSDPVVSEEEEVKAEKPKRKTRAKAKKAEKEAETSAEEKQEDSVEEESETP